MASHDDPVLARDRELVRAVQIEGAPAFERLYSEHSGWVNALALRSTGNPDEAADVVQETFSYLLRKLPELELTARLRTFLYPVVRHLAADARKKSGRYASDAEALEGARAERVDRMNEGERGASAREELAGALRSLPDGQREVLLMRYADELPLEDIATALDIPVGTVKSRMHHALASLREVPELRARFFEGR